MMAATFLCLGVYVPRRYVHVFDMARVPMSILMAMEFQCLVSVWSIMFYQCVACALAQSFDAKLYRYVSQLVLKQGGQAVEIQTYNIFGRRSFHVSRLAT